MLICTARGVWQREGVGLRRRPLAAMFGTARDGYVPSGVAST